MDKIRAALNFVFDMSRIAAVNEVSYNDEESIVRVFFRIEDEGDGQDEACISLNLAHRRFSVQDQDGNPLTGYDGAKSWSGIYDALLDCGMADFAIRAHKLNLE